jgi:hypothetical protein
VLSSKSPEGVDRNWLAGPHGFFRGTIDVTVTLESLGGTRLTGTFSANVVNTGTSALDESPDGREFDITDGRFEVDPSPSARAAN